MLIPVSIGELFDKFTILQIKMERIHNRERRLNITREIEQLRSHVEGVEFDSKDEITSQLKRVNETIWNIEDKLHHLEKNGSFGDDFVATARKAYTTNDERFRLKTQINKLTESFIVEEKSY